jgi:hypothetical protein
MDVLHPRCCGFQPLSSWPVGPRCVQASTKVPANVRAVQLVKGVQGSAAWLVNARGLPRTKNTYLSSHFRRLAARRGKKRAVIAVAHTLIVIGYRLQKNQSNYDDLGGNYFDRIHSDGLKRYLVKRRQELGHQVTLEPMEAV